MCYANDNADFFPPPRSMSSVLVETLKRSAFYLHWIHGGLLRHATAHSSACKQKNSHSLQRFNICATGTFLTSCRSPQRHRTRTKKPLRTLRNHLRHATARSMVFTFTAADRNVARHVGQHDKLPRRAAGML